MSISKGDIIQCPQCGLDLYEATRDLVRGELIKVEMFNSIGDVPEPQPGLRMKCHKCSTDWFLCGKLHIKDQGWV